MAEEIKPKTEQEASKLTCHWLPAQDILNLDNSGIDLLAKGIVSQIDNNSQIYSLDILDTMDSNGVRKIKGNLERQMLEEAGYGQSGNECQML